MDSWTRRLTCRKNRKCRAPNWRPTSSNGSELTCSAGSEWIHRSQSGKSVERSYQMSADYHRLYQDILTYCREYVSDQGMVEQRQRVRYWAALSILRCVLSSPMAARAVLANRKPSLAGRQNGAVLDEVFGQQIMDSADEDQATDYVPTAPLSDSDSTLDAS